MNPLEFTAQVALVTGGGSGMGLAAAQAFADAGAAIALVDINADAVHAAADQLTAGGTPGGSAGVRRLRRKPRSPRVWRRRLRPSAGWTWPFNNAGIQIPYVGSADETGADFDRVNAINYRGVWGAMKHQLAQMRAQGSGAIVNCSSIGAASLTTRSPPL